MKTGYLTNVQKIENRIAMKVAKIKRLNQWIAERTAQRIVTEDELSSLCRLLRDAKQKQ